MTRLQNRAALITGGGAGIGAATALLFCTEGAAVTLVDADASALAKTAEAIRAQVPGARLAHYAADVADADLAARAVRHGLDALSHAHKSAAPCTPPQGSRTPSRTIINIGTSIQAPVRLLQPNQRPNPRSTTPATPSTPCCIAR